MRLYSIQESQGKDSSANLEAGSEAEAWKNSTLLAFCEGWIFKFLFVSDGILVLCSPMPTAQG